MIQHAVSQFPFGNRLSRVALGIALFGAILAGPNKAYAQVQNALPAVFKSIDSTGVDTSTGQFHWSTIEVVIGQPGIGGLAHGRSWIGTGWRDHLAGTISSSGSIYTVSIGGSSETFSYSGGLFTSLRAIGSTLTLSGSKYTYRLSGGTDFEFDTGVASCSGVTTFWACNQATITKLIKPDGEVVTWTYNTGSYGGGTGLRPQSVSNNLGYQVHFTYDDAGDWLKRTKVTGINRAYYYCADTATTCSDSTGGNWPNVTYGTESGGIESVTDRLSQTTRYIFASGQLTGVRLPTSSTANRWDVAYASGKVSNVSGAIGEPFSTDYSYSDASGVRTTTTASYFGSGSSITKTDLANGWVTELWQDSSGTRKTVLTRDGYGRVERTTRADGDYTNLTYDGRGNVTVMTEAPTSGSSISTSATFTQSCSTYPKSCNKPDTATDAKGQVTNYDYDATHGGLTKVTLPASGSGPYSSVRPETRFTYDALSAWYKNSGGSLVQAPSTVYRVVETSACATGSVSSSCVGTADESRMVISYEAGSSSVASNLLSVSATARSGNTSGAGAVSATTVSTYSVQGDVLTIDGPLSGSGDTTSFFYDDVRRPRATVGADPDGGGTLQHRVAKVSYDAEGRPTSTELGYVSSPSSWNSLTVLQQQDLTYDNAFGILAKSAIVSSGTTYSVTQYGISAPSGRCVAVRMNPSEFGSLTSDACALDTAGSFGSDRIGYSGISVYNEFTSVLSGYPNGSRTEAELKYDDSSGVLEWREDAADNRTSYEYDTFFRLKKTLYPSPSTPGSSNSSDYEELTYDAYGRLEKSRVRDPSTTYEFDSDFDNLDRVTALNAPGSQPDISYQYDNLGRMTQASQSGHTNSYAYDALGRMTSETQAGRTVSYEYDAAGRRTKMTWPDSFYVNYDYNTVGELTAIRENGATSGAGVLATFSYDNLGRRTALSRGNGGATGYAYDGASRLIDLAIDPTGSSNDMWTDLSYNPANQIVSRTINNSSYNFSLPSAYADTYADNGLNQYTSAGGVTPTYDARGNMTYDGARTYGYDYSNKMISAGSASLSYDPTDRLFQVAGGATTQFLYDGADIIAEYQSGSIVRRYVHGPGLDEPLVWYEGSGTSDRRHLYADERGSIVTVEGSSTSVYTYDEYGVPGASQTGRFQYTGQMWLSDVGLYHYKARAYSPELGRFMQTDPIGYAAGMNLYNYVNADPVNLVDSFGLTPEPPTDIVRVTGPVTNPNSYDCTGFDAWACDEIYDILVRGGYEPSFEVPFDIVLGDGLALQCVQSPYQGLICLNNTDRVVVTGPRYTKEEAERALDRARLEFGLMAAPTVGALCLWVCPAMLGLEGSGAMLYTGVPVRAAIAPGNAVPGSAIPYALRADPLAGTTRTVGTPWNPNLAAPRAPNDLLGTLMELIFGGPGSSW